MARGKYKLKKQRQMTTPQQKVEKVVEQVLKSSDAAEALGRIQAKYNAADKKGKKKLQKQLDKARKAAKEAAQLVAETVVEEDNSDAELQRLMEDLRNDLEGIDWNGADPSDFWSYSDSARAWAHDHLDYDWGSINEDEIF